jgi:hypothetical protein
LDAREENAIERRDKLLDELRRLAGRWPDDTAIRERLAKGLPVIFMESENDAAVWSLWQEFVAVSLAQAHADEAWVPLIVEMQQAVSSDESD